MPLLQLILIRPVLRLDITEMRVVKIPATTNARLDVQTPVNVETELVPVEIPMLPIIVIMETSVPVQGIVRVLIAAGIVLLQAAAAEMAPAKELDHLVIRLPVLISAEQAIVV